MVWFYAGARKRVPQTTAESLFRGNLVVLRFGARRKGEESDAQGGQGREEEGWKMQENS